MKHCTGCPGFRRAHGPRVSVTTSAPTKWSQGHLLLVCFPRKAVASRDASSVSVPGLALCVGLHILVCVRTSQWDALSQDWNVQERQIILGQTLTYNMMNSVPLQSRCFAPSFLDSDRHSLSLTSSLKKT